MIARFTVSVLLGAVLVAAALLSIGAASPDSTAFAAADVTTASSTIVPPAPPAAADPAPRPSDALHNPIDDIGGAIDDAASARRHGWPLLALVGLVLVSRGLAKARKRWPGSRALGWMGGRVGLVVIGSGMVGAAAFDALVLSGSWVAAAYAAIGTALLLLDPEPHPSAARKPQRGSVASPLLAILFGAAIAASSVTAWSCSSAQRRAVAEDVVDCTIDVARAHSAEYGALVEAALRAAVRSDGTIDWTAIRTAAAGFGLQTGACALAAVVARLLTTPEASAPELLPAAPPGPRGVELRAGWERLRRELWDGRRFRVEHGVL